MLPRRNVLIFHSGALGDFILTWPLALALGRLYPQSRIYYVTHGSKAALAEKVLRVEGADFEAGWHALHSADAALPAPAEKLLTSAHAVFTFLSDGSDAWAQRVRQIASAAELIPLAPPARDLRGRVHAADFIAEQLAPWPVVQTAVRQILRSVADRGVGYRLSPDGSVVIHPGSGSPRKNWAVERYAELGKRLRDAGRMVKFVLGEVELEKWRGGEIEALAAVGEVVRPVDYLALLRVLETASCFVGNDSGPGHLAGIIGVPTVSVFEGTDPTVWRPLGPKVKVVGGEALEKVTVDEVLGEIGS